MRHILIWEAIIGTKGKSLLLFLSPNSKVPSQSKLYYAISCSTAAPPPAREAVGILCSGRPIYSVIDRLAGQPAAERNQVVGGSVVKG